MSLSAIESDQDEPPTANCDDPSSCRPSLPRMKSCLKSPSHSGAATPVDSDTDDGSLSLCKKHVAFSEEGTEQVFQADEWDRTPTEIAQRLSYEDVLELKMIQRSLPRAQQHHDPLSSRPYSGVFLRNVPIPLLPLNPTTVSASPSSPPSSPSMRSPPTSPPRNTGYSALDLHPNSIFFASPPKQRRKPMSTQPKEDSLPSPFPVLKSHSITVPPPPPAPSELRPHNIAVPPPPLPPPRTSTNPLPPIPSNLPPPKRFAFLPLMDDTTAGPSFSSLSPNSPTHTQTDYPFSELETSYNSDTDCSLFASDTEFSTPSLTTASLASSSPPESPGMSTSTSPALEYGHPGSAREYGYGGAGTEENFILNLDVDPDVDADSCVSDSYFPRMPARGSMGPTLGSMGPKRGSGMPTCGSMGMPTRDQISSSTPTHGPISNFHARHPHPSQPRSSTSTSSKPNLSAVPSPGLPAPSPLELSQMKAPVGGAMQMQMGMKPVVAPRKKFAMPIVALAESPSSPQSLGMGRKEGCEYAQFRAGDGQGQGGQVQRQNISRCQ